MLSTKPQLNLRHAREYFREHLSAGDYYAEGRRIVGHWFGQGAEKLGLKGTVNEREFLALCDGLNPQSGGQMTLRRNTHRHEGGKTVANRRVFYDFTLSPPKSVSIAALMHDDRILALHEKAVGTAMAELEKFAQTRVRKAGQTGARVSGNLVGAAFRHDTSRELDPHLHTHCVIFNASFDPVESRWKALEVHGMYRAKKLAENLYYHELCRGLRHLGYGIENNARDFELRGLPASLIARFSKRHQQIDAETRRRIESEGFRGNVKALRRQLAENDRRRKIKNSTAERLLPDWRRQMSPDETRALAALGSKAARPNGGIDAAAAVAWAEEHLFERKAVAREEELWSEALGRARGEDISLASIREAAERRGFVRDPETGRITTPEVLRCETGVVLAARHGRNSCAPLNPGHRVSPGVSDEQRAAVAEILESQDFITLFRGGAGTGKSFTLREVKRGLEAAGHPVVVLAPQRQQVAGLLADGLAAETLAACLQADALPAKAVVIVDEAGQIGARQLHRLLERVRGRDGRLILSGDTRQHGAVEASDALVAIERYSGARAANVREIRRQDPELGRSAAERKSILGYRAAVKEASLGRTGESFMRLDRLGWVREIPEPERCGAVAREYVDIVGRGERTLVVAQTWADVHRLNDAIRAQLVAEGRIGSGTALKSYQAADLDLAQKRDPRFYEPGRFAHFHQGYGRFLRGDLCAIAGADERGVLLVKGGRPSWMSYRYASRFVVAAEHELEIAPGDRLQLKFNGRSDDGRAIVNGELVTVESVGTDGRLGVKGDDGARKILSASQRLFHRGYAVTSYSSQGKTVDSVLISDCGCQAVADQRHWYVAISRGRRRALVFTSDKETLRANIEHSGERPLALDLNPSGPGAGRSVRHRMRHWIKRVLGITERHRQHEQTIAIATAQPVLGRRLDREAIEASQDWRIRI